MVPIVLENVLKRFDTTRAVDSVSLRIEPGELFFLLGPSGCGKTTLLRILAGLIEPTSGRVLFGDRDVTHVPTGQRETALVFQSYALWPHMTVSQNVAFGLDVRGLGSTEKQSRVRQALQTVRMTEFADRRPAQLSGGQQQRVALARALAVEPKILLLDEPLSNLDAKLRIEMREEIRRICNETRITSVYVTHDQEEALSMADRIAVMHQGTLLQVGTPEEIYDSPNSRFVAAFLGQTNFISGTVEAREAEILSIRTPAGTLRAQHRRNGLDVGTSVTCSIRPEATRLLEANQKADNMLDGRLTHTTYLGPSAQHLLEVEPDMLLRVNQLKPRRREQVGEVLRIGFDASDIVLLSH